MQVKDKKYLGGVWRVDSELLTINCISCRSIADDTPLDVWLRASLGGGCYCYFSDCEDAKTALLAIIDLKIVALNDRKSAVSLIDVNV